jgi:two-component system, NarL family, nitrate/nitrite response regulator NarL
VGHLINDHSVLLLGAHPLFVAGMRSAFCGRRFCRILEVGNRETALAAIARTRPDAVILELGGDEAEFDVVSRLLAAHPRIRLIVVAEGESGGGAVRALEAGAVGYLTSRSTPEELVEATRLVLEGQTFVSPTAASQAIAAMRQAVAREAKAVRTALNLREEQIAVHLLQGHTNREIAASLGLREKTVKHYMTLMMQKFNVRNRLELALSLRQHDGLPGRGRSCVHESETGPATARSGAQPEFGRARRLPGYANRNAA